MEGVGWISIQDSSSAGTNLIDVLSSRDGVDVEIPSSNEDVISVQSSEPHFAMPVFSMDAGDSDANPPSARSSTTSSNVELLEARVAAARAAREAAEARAAEAAAQAELMEARALSTRSQVSSRPTSSTHERHMRQMLEIHGTPLHQPVLPVTERDQTQRDAVDPRPMMAQRASQSLEADRRLAEELQRRELQSPGEQNLGPSSTNQHGDTRNGQIERLQAEVKDLRAQQRLSNQKPPEVQVHTTVPPSWATSTAMADLAEVFPATAGAFGTAMTRIPSEIFATPHITEDLIDLSSPDRGQAPRHQDLVPDISRSPGYREQINELRNELSNIRAQIPALPSWSTVDLPPGLPSVQLQQDIAQPQVESNPHGLGHDDHSPGDEVIDPEHPAHMPETTDEARIFSGVPPLDPMRGIEGPLELLDPVMTSVSRSKEPDTIRLIGLPDMAKFEEWKCNVRDEVTAAAGGSTDAYLWILQVEDSRISYEQLEDARQFKSIDAKIAAAVSRIQKGELAKVITSKKKEAARLLRRISGRQQLRLVYDQYRLDAEDGQLFDIEDLMAIKFPGDDHLESFIINWDTGLLALVDDPGEELKRSLFHRLIRHSTKMRDVLTRYTLASRGSHERSYRFLHSGVHQIVDMERNSRNRRDLIQSRNAVGGKGRPTMAAHEQSDIPPPSLAPKGQQDDAKITMAAKGAGKGKSSRPCYDWMLGKCNRGSGCPFSHSGPQGVGQDAVDKEKKALAQKRSEIPCEMHRKGKCRFGDKCQFLHSEGEAPSPAGVCQTQEMSATRSMAMITISDDSPEWCLDTGSENHLVNQSSIDPQDFEKHAYETSRPLRLATANGEIVAKTRIDHHLEKVNLTINPLVLRNTVKAISVGRLVIDNGMKFHWDHLGAYLIDDQGRRIECVIRGYVPMLRDEGSGDRDDLDGDPATTMPGLEAPSSSQEPQSAPPDAGPALESEIADPLQDEDADAALREDHGPEPDQDQEDASEESQEQRLRREANSLEHSLTHRPKNPFCTWCMRAKVQKKQARRRDPDTNHMTVKQFGDLIQCDHVILHREEHAGLDGERAGLFVMDTFTDVCDLVPTKGKTAEEAAVALRYFVGNREMKFMYSDNSKELMRTAELLQVPHPTSTPYRPENNGKVERRIGVMAEGVRAALLQSGLPHRFWTLAAKHHLFASAITLNPRASDGLTAWERHHGEPFSGMRLPFGCLVFFRPKKPVMDSLAKFAPRTVPGIFMGWHTKPGYEFQGDYMVIALAAFRPTEADSARTFNVFRVKEVVHLEPLKFPLQGSNDGVDLQGIVDLDWDSRSFEIRDHEDSDTEDPDRFDKPYEDLFGMAPPDHMTPAEKYEAITEHLFGQEDVAAGEVIGMMNQDPIVEEEDLKRMQEMSERDLFGDLGDQNTWEKNQDSRGAKMPIPRAKKLPGARVKKESTSKQPSSSSGHAAISWTTDPGAMLDRGYLSMVAENRMYDRLILEYCCSSNSKIGQQASHSRGCEVIRLTEEINMASEGGFLWAEAQIAKVPKTTYLFMWSAIPCTPGSPWQRINRLKPGVAESIDAQILVTKKLVNNFCRLARTVLMRGGDVAFEWPAQCSLWDLPEVTSMITELSLNKVRLDGCAVGLRSTKGIPIMKPWSIATSSPKIFEHFEPLRCPKDHAHCPCAGGETKRTELYTDEMVKLIHKSVDEEARDRRANISMAVMDKVAVDDHLEAHLSEYGGPDAESYLPADGHRPKIMDAPLWCCMVTKTLSPKDPLRHDPRAKVAIDKELGDLRSVPTWDEQNVMEGSKAAADFPDAHFARLFAILGIKHYEEADESLHSWRARCVLSGDAIKTATGDWAMFNELGSVPANMTACRCLLAAYCMTEDALLLQSDCIKAYVQAEMKGPPTFVRLPRAWWPESWKDMKDPVCRLLRAIYGHPQSGDIWADKLTAELQKEGFEVIEAWPSVFKCLKDGKLVALFIVYVDDLVMMGTPAMKPILERLRKVIQMEEPHDMGKYLGCTHHMSTRTILGELVTHVKFDMRQYFRSALEQYRTLSGKSVSIVATPHAPRIDPKDMNSLIETPGELAPHAASLLMKLMYGTRMAFPALAVVISRLASQVTKWTADSDRRLHRVYCYLSGALDQVLTGELATSDREMARIQAWPDADLNGCHLTTKSTSGFFLNIVGSNGRIFPLGWGSKKQGATAQHTAEAELISLASCLRSELIPVQSLMQEILQRPVEAELLEDNAATIIAVNRGYSLAMRHVRRTQRTSLGLIHDMITEEPEEGQGRIRLIKASTADHLGDAFTKELDPRAFKDAMTAIGMRTMSEDTA